MTVSCATPIASGSSLASGTVLAKAAGESTVIWVSYLAARLVNGRGQRNASFSAGRNAHTRRPPPGSAPPLGDLEAGRHRIATCEIVTVNPVTRGQQAEISCLLAPARLAAASR